MAATAAAATDATPTTTDATAAGIEPPAGERTTAKQRAASSRALEEAVRSIGAIATRAGTCGDDAHALTVFCDIVAAMATTPARAGSGGDADGRGPGGEDLRAASIETLRAVIRSMATTTTTVTAPELSPSSSSSSSPRPLSGSRSQAFRTLTSDAALPALGYAVSCLLDAERAEAAKGALGSRAIRADALRCLGELVSAIDDADALAFFLPGVVSGLTRALVASAGSRPGHGSGVVAVVGDANATEAAIEALAAVVVIVMNDDACGGLVSARRRRGAAGGGAADDDDDAEAEAASTAAALRKLAARGERSRSRSRSRGRRRRRRRRGRIRRRRIRRRGRTERRRRRRAIAEAATHAEVAQRDVPKGHRRDARVAVVAREPRQAVRPRRGRVRGVVDRAQVRSISHWFPYDPVAVVDADP